MNRLHAIIFAIVIQSSTGFADSSAKSTDFYITGYETSATAKLGSGNSATSVIEMPYDWEPYQNSHPTNKQPTWNSQGKSNTLKAARISAAENTDGLRKTLESFQNAITGLCITHLELSLAFNVSAKAWMIVTGEVAGSVKVLLKNPDEKCPKAGS